MVVLDKWIRVSMARVHCQTLRRECAPICWDDRNVSFQLKAVSYLAEQWKSSNLFRWLGPFS